MVKDYLCEVLVFTRHEFFEHPSYNQIQLINSFMYWNISSKAEYVIVAQPNWILNLPKDTTQGILLRQYEMKRGLIFPLSLFSSVDVIPDEYIVDGENQKLVIIQSNFWNNLPYQVKEYAIKEYAQLWEDWYSYSLPEQTPVHIRKYANQFSTCSGSNCLAATLYAISEQEWIISEWVFPDTFAKRLEVLNSSYVSSDLEKGDVIIWKNSDGVIQHAAYHIGDNLFFNKNGKTFFNPWKILHLDELIKEWSEFKMTIYRKNDE